MFFAMSMAVVLATSANGTVISGTGSSAAGLTDYPGFSRPHAQVEAIIDRGPIQELIVKCGAEGTAIISYSKLDRRFCTPRLQCDPSLRAVVARTCGRD